KIPGNPGKAGSKKVVKKSKCSNKENYNDECSPSAKKTTTDKHIPSIIMSEKEKAFLENIVNTSRPSTSFTTALSPPTISPYDPITSDMEDDMEFEETSNSIEFNLNLDASDLVGGTNHVIAAENWWQSAKKFGISIVPELKQDN
ncbi:MAG: hypothetical protein AAF529_14240, partial [Pseudomonadota bacterium]